MLGPNNDTRKSVSVIIHTNFAGAFFLANSAGKALGELPNCPNPDDHTQPWIIEKPWGLNGWWIVMFEGTYIRDIDESHKRIISCDGDTCVSQDF